MIAGRSEAPLAGAPAGLFARAAAAPHRALFLDFDGTLAAFSVRREEARIDPGTARRLERIAAGGRTTVTIVSGRSLADLSERVGPIRAALVGEHGWETRAPDGPPRRAPLDDRRRAALEEAASLAERRGWAPALERKRSALVLHTRGLEGRAAETLVREGRRLWRPVAMRGGLRLDAIDGGLEIRAAGRDKGDAVREALAALPPGTLAVYIGDDVTDEDAFLAVAAHGFGLVVGSGDRPSAAAGRLRDVAAVRAFLERWERVVEGAPAMHGGRP